VIGGYINGLGVARALAALGIHTSVVRTAAFDIAHHSRAVASHDAALDVATRPESLLELLERRASDWSGAALFPACDEALSVLSRHRERLSADYRVLAPPWDVARHVLDKALLLQAARATGIRAPHYYGVANAATAALPGIRFPVIVKPFVSCEFQARFATKLFVAYDRPELERCVSRVAGAECACGVFDLVPGDDAQIYAYGTYVDTRGEPRAGVTIRKLRQSPPHFGVARVAELTDDQPGLREATIELLRQIGYHGIAVAEFKRDPRTGAFQFLEVNGRSTIYNGLLRRGGVDLSALAWADQVDGEPISAASNGWPGVWVNLHADLLYSALGRRLDPLSFSEFLAPYARPVTHAVWAARDPGPFLALWSRTLREGVATLARGADSPRLADRTRCPADRGTAGTGLH